MGVCPRHQSASKDDRSTKVVVATAAPLVAPRPRESGNIGDRIIAGEALPFGELAVDHAVEAFRFRENRATAWDTSSRARSKK
jgi:hypothetical protein